MSLPQKTTCSGAIAAETRKRAGGNDERRVLTLPVVLRRSLACFASALVLACTLAVPLRGAPGPNGWTGAEKAPALHQAGRTEGSVGRLADHRLPAGTSHGVPVALVAAALVDRTRTPWILLALDRSDGGPRFLTSRAHACRGPPERSL